MGSTILSNNAHAPQHPADSPNGCSKQAHMQAPTCSTTPLHMVHCRVPSGCIKSGMSKLSYSCSTRKAGTHQAHIADVALLAPGEDTPHSYLPLVRSRATHLSTVGCLAHVFGDSLLSVQLILSRQAAGDLHECCSSTINRPGEPEVQTLR